MVYLSSFVHENGAISNRQLSCNLIGSSNGRNFSIFPANSGGFAFLHLSQDVGLVFLRKKVKMLFTAVGWCVFVKTMRSVLTTALGSVLKTSCTILPNMDLPAGEKQRFFIHCNGGLVIRYLYSFVSHSSRECYPHKPVSGLCLRELSEFCLPLVTLKQAQPSVSQLHFLIIIFVATLINRDFMQPRWQSLREPEKQKV